MGTKENAASIRNSLGGYTVARIVAGNDIGTLQRCAVVASERGLLGRNLATELLKLLDNPLGTQLMGIAVHRAGTEIALRLTIGIGGIGHKSRTYGRQR